MEAGGARTRRDSDYWIARDTAAEFKVALVREKLEQIGVKPDTAKPPLKSLQIRYGEPGMEGAADGIRMTMYYYDNASHPSPNSSGHFAYDYKMQDHCGLDGIEGGPNWWVGECEEGTGGAMKERHE